MDDVGLIGQIVVQGRGDQIEILAAWPSRIHDLDQSGAEFAFKPAGQRSGAPSGADDQGRPGRLQGLTAGAGETTTGIATKGVVPAAPSIIPDVLDQKGSSKASATPSAWATLPGRSSARTQIRSSAIVLTGCSWLGLTTSDNQLSML